MKKTISLPTSRHFTLHQLAHGVFAAIAVSTGGAFSNAGIIDLGDRTLIFDSLQSPVAAADLRQAAIDLTSRSPDMVLVSHSHGDHWGGIQVFADCMLLATPVTRQGMAATLEEMLRLKDNPAEIIEEINKAEEGLQTVTDERQRAELKAVIARRRVMLELLPNLQPTLPNQVFEEELTLQGPARQARIIPMGAGHTDSDSLIFLPDDRVAFIGDLGFFQCLPVMAVSQPEAWLAILDTLASWKIDIYVPGHGPLGSKSDLALQAQFIQTMEETFGRLARSGVSVEEALLQTLPSPFDAWQEQNLRRFEANVRFVYGRADIHS
jgi:cyclase